MPRIINYIKRNLSLGMFRDILIIQSQENRKTSHKNPFVSYGRKTFSQSDEDGLTVEIIERLNILNGNFIEFGVGNGMENNTLLLLALNWKGFWFGGKKLAFETSKSTKLTFGKVWITKENIAELYSKALKKLESIDLVSLDLDGNDYYFIEELLVKNFTPKIFIIEYNSKFIPPIEFIIDYSPEHNWQGDDYFGASLTSFNSLFEKFGYTLICCNSGTGCNAFFVRNEFIDLFPEIPTNLKDKYSSPFYWTPKLNGHNNSIKTIKKIVNT